MVHVILTEDVWISLYLLSLRVSMTAAAAITIAEAAVRIRAICGIAHVCPVTLNKGKPGILLEQLCGIPQTSNCLDCTDGEIKSFPLKRTRTGVLVPKETVAVTMLDRALLATQTFEESRCYAKLRHTLFVPYLREGDAVTFMEPRLVCLDDAPVLCGRLRVDYDAIRDGFVRDGTLTSATGVYLQTRTKGAGHGSTSRAFYLRVAFLTDFILTSTTVTTA